MTERIETESAVDRYFDEEMSPEEARAFRDQLAADPALEAELQVMKVSREMLVAHVEAQVDQADFSGFFDRISSALPQASVVSEPAPSAARSPAAATPPSMGARIKAWWARHWTPVLISAAAAAAVAFFVTRAAAPSVDDEDGAAPIAAGEEVTVDEVNSDGPTTVLVSMPADDEDSTVIWLLDEDEEEDQAGADDAALAEEDPI